ncbi:hypothetical protein [uncultured Roseivirga sp.]|uniref:hypothetical protein n=1 Tax=uncultured Roseivirga sp. TaxID=543088 RepID=UPI0030D87064|tara:strand:+ start:63930 stop:64664 length:735 start_codon:yes stop_codon:yes gene_type:complete
MNSLTRLRRSIVIGCLSILFFFKVSAQENVETFLKMTRPQAEKFNRKNVISAFLQSCAKFDENTTETPYPDACNKLEYLHNYAKSFTEVYYTVLKDDKSFDEAGFNDFKRNQVREKFKARTEEARADILGLPDEFTQVIPYTFQGGQYDFENEILPFGLSASWQRLEIKLTDGKTNRHVRVQIKVPMAKAEKLFANDKARFDAVLIITYGDLFEDQSQRQLTGVVKDVKVYQKETGELLWQKKY